jgi:hypothetical protein
MDVFILLIYFSMLRCSTLHALHYLTLDLNFVFYDISYYSSAILHLHVCKINRSDEINKMW